MVVEDIVTSLKNAIEHGDSLETAMQLAINSGYSPKDVQEAAQYVSGSSIAYLQQKPGEQLTMPSQKSIITGNPINIPPSQLTQHQTSDLYKPIFPNTPIQKPIKEEFQSTPQYQQQYQQYPSYPSQQPKSILSQMSQPPRRITRPMMSNLPTRPLNQQIQTPSFNSQIPTQPISNQIQPINNPVSTQPINSQIPTQPINNQITNIRQDTDAIKENITLGSVYSAQSNQSLSNELKQIKPAGESYVKEIILIIILLILIGVLIASFVFKEQIIAFLNSL